MQNCKSNKNNNNDADADECGAQKGNLCIFNNNMQYFVEAARLTGSRRRRRQRQRRQKLPGATRMNKAFLTHKCFVIYEQ